MNTDSYKVLKLSNGEMIVCELNATMIKCMIL